MSGKCGPSSRSAEIRAVEAESDNPMEVQDGNRPERQVLT